MVMFVGMGHTVVGVLVGVGVVMLMCVAVATDVIMIQMHKKFSFCVFSSL
jgi:hypothetical protein